MNLIAGALGTLLILAGSAAQAVSVGVYTATFDPPTEARLRIVRCALGDVDLSQDCRELGRDISRLFVLVREDPGADTLASTRERTLMVQRALAPYGDRVRVLSANPRQADERTHALLSDATIERVYQIVAGDLYGTTTPPAPVTGKAQLVTVLFPLEADGGAAAPGDHWAHRVNEPVKAVMDRLGLYRQVGEDLTGLQRALFEEGWRGFIDDLARVCPSTIQRQQCDNLAPRWKATSIVAAGGGAQSRRAEAAPERRLVYKKAQSEDRWAEKYVSTALSGLRGADGYDKMEEVANDIAARTLQGYPRGKVPHLMRAAVPARQVAPEAATVTPRPVSCSAPAGEYNMDIDQYTADRFPREFKNFLTAGYRKYSRLPIELYVHNNTFEHAYEFHRRAGFDRFYFLQTRRGQLHRDIYLAVKSRPRAYRVVLTGVRGHDRMANVLCQIHWTGVFSRFRFVRSPREEPLFVLNSAGANLKLDKNDWLLFGFRGSWRRKLQANHWRMTSLVKQGLDVDLFVHPDKPHKIITVRNVFGDDANIVLNTFYKKGARKIIYLGSAGAIQDYEVGDVVIPNEFVDPGGNFIPFHGNLAHAYAEELAKSVRVHRQTRNAWAPHLYEETVAVLEAWKAQSVAAVDIEGLYLGRFAQRHDDLKLAVLFVISDETLGENTIEYSNAYRGLIDDSVDKILSVLLPVVLRDP